MVEDRGIARSTQNIIQSGMHFEFNFCIIGGDKLLCQLCHVSAEQSNLLCSLQFKQNEHRLMSIATILFSFNMVAQYNDSAWTSFVYNDFYGAVP